MTNERVPHDLEAEQAVLGAFLLDGKSYWEVCDMVEPGDFYNQRHRHIYQAIIDLVRQRVEQFDPITVRDQLERNDVLSQSGGIDYVAELSTVTPSTASIKHYAKIVLDASVRRRIMKAAKEMAALALDENNSIEDVRSLAEATVYESLAGSMSDVYERRSNAIHEIHDRYVALRDGGQQYTGILSNIKALDKRTLGFQKGDLIVLAARPSTGKTACAGQMALAATGAGWSPVFFSLEMSERAITERMICNLSKLSSSVFRYGRCSPEDERKLFLTMDTLRSLPLIIDDTPNLNMPRIASKARRYAMMGKCDIIFIDYLQLVRLGQKVGNEVEEVTKVSAAMKQLARELNVPVVCLSQLSRNTELRADRRPQLSDLRGSGAIEQDADIVLFLWREKQYDKNASEAERNETRLLIEKHRNGPTGEVLLQYIGDKFLFVEIDQQQHVVGAA